MPETKQTIAPTYVPTVPKPSTQLPSPTLPPSEIGSGTTQPVVPGEPTGAPLTFKPSTVSPTPNDALRSSVMADLRFSPMSQNLSTASNQTTGLPAWKYVTENHIKRTAEAENIVVYRIEISNISQELMVSRQRVKSLRVLAQNQTLDISFDLFMSYSTGVKPVPSINTIFLDAFDTERDRIDYMLELGRHDKIFSSIPPPVVQASITAQAKSPESSKNIETGAITGIAVGVIALLLVVIGGLLFRRKKHEKSYATGSTFEIHDSQTCVPIDATCPPKVDPQSQYTDEIVVDTFRDDVSTLGPGSVFGEINANDREIATVEDKTTTVNLDYDFIQQQYSIDDAGFPSRTVTEATTTSGSELLKLGAMVGREIIADDRSLEDVFTGERDFGSTGKNGLQATTFAVRVPPGFLGFRVCSTNGGVPVVRDIRDDSILRGRVQIGDKLISVDQQDVSKMSGEQVSKLIGSKREYYRLLIFVRLKEEGEC
jgi:LPXTG-motif cell wall-anchored protein